MGHDTGYGKAVAEELSALGRELREAIPEVYQGYARLARACMGPGVLDAKTKELIALAIAVSKECDGCIAAHARNAARHHASEQEVAEAIGVAILMNGGPGTVYGPRAFAAFREYLADRDG